MGRTNEVLDHSDIEPVDFVVLGEEAEGAGRGKRR